MCLVLQVETIAFLAAANIAYTCEETLRHNESFDFYDPYLMDNGVGISPPKESSTIYVKEVLRMGSSVLDLGCGTGRLLIPLAKKGAEVIGLDLSSRMLTWLVEKLRELPASVSGRIELFRGDFRFFSLHKKFSSIIFAGEGIVHLLNEKDVIDCFTRVKRHLSVDGAFLLDFSPPDMNYLQSQCDQLNPTKRFIGTFKVETKLIKVWDLASYDPNRHLLTARVFYRLTTKKGEGLSNWTRDVRIRTWSRQEIIKLLKLAGFEKCTEFANLESRDLRTRLVMFSASI
jgi:ubiquinone/menaquinone biosynthesis C-methylase UbiE